MTRWFLKTPDTKLYVHQIVFITFGIQKSKKRSSSHTKLGHDEVEHIQATYQYNCGVCWQECRSHVNNRG